MITDAILNIAYFAVSGLVSALPAGGGFPSEVHAAATALGGYAGVLDSILPIPTLLATTTLVFTFELAIFGFKTAKWLLSYVPFIGGK